MGRRFRVWFQVWAVFGLTIGVVPQLARAATRPNVLIVITDDQGNGDLGLHGNPVIRTPHLDRLGRESVRLTRFYVSPVCSPTRASLMTGRYNYRTRVVDTYIGRSMMDPDEVTLAERLSAAGYRTGIFGKWHLGDHAPMRPIDQGFQEALVLLGGGIGQPSDPPGGESYFDPILQHNGRPERRPGYCSDVFTDAAMAFLTESKGQGKPFFAYVAFNAPHDPLQVPAADLRAYDGVDLSADRFPQKGYPLRETAPRDTTARVYAMVSNLDANVGRLLGRLEQLALARDTLVIFLTDNGPAQARYNSGLRGRKGTVYEGGIRVPCFLRLPGTLRGGTESPVPSAHIDLAPTVLEACGLEPGPGPKFDGVSLWPWVGGGTPPDPFPERTLFLQWHRGDRPEAFRAFAARGPRFKLVRAEGPTAPRPPKFELFDLAADPFEQHDVADTFPEEVARLREAYSRWFEDVSRSRGFDPPRILVGSDRENPVTLTRQDWRGLRAGWTKESLGHWEVRVARAGDYRARVRLRPAAERGVIHVKVGESHVRVPVTAGKLEPVLQLGPLPEGPARVEAWLEDGETTRGVWAVEVERQE